MKNRLFVIALLFLAVACAEKPAPSPGPDDPGDSKFPEIPKYPEESNLFAVEYFLSLPASGQISDHILNAPGKKPIVYIFRDVRYVPGQANRLVECAGLSKSFPFFIQKGATSVTGNDGGGFLTRYAVSKFDGDCCPISIGGPTIKTALKSVVDITFYSCDFSDREQMSAIAKSMSKSLYGEAVILGTFDGSLDGVEEFTGEKGLGMRFDCVSVSGKNVFTLVQPAYVNRGFEKLSLGGVEYVKVLFERLY